MPGASELRGGHRRDAGLKRRQSCHRRRSVRTLAVDDADARSRARAARVPAAHRGRPPRAPARRLRRSRCSSAGSGSPGRFVRERGYAGFSANRHEGDGTTPIGTFAIGPTVYGLDPNPGVRLAYQRLRCGDWWDGDSDAHRPTTTSATSRAAPNRPSRAEAKRCGARPVAYREFAFIEYNASPARPGRGSAIFLHDDLGHATNGCLSLPRTAADRAPAAAAGRRRRSRISA